MGAVPNIAVSGAISVSKFYGKSFIGSSAETVPPVAMAGSTHSTSDGSYSAANRYTGNLDDYTFGGWRAFDGSVSTYAWKYADHYSRATCTVTLDNWVLLQQPKAVRTKSYSVYLTPEVGCPVSWVLEGSPDGVAYYPIDTRTDVAVGGSGSTQTFTVAAAGPALNSPWSSGAD